MYTHSKKILMYTGGIECGAIIGLGHELLSLLGEYTCAD